MKKQDIEVILDNIQEIKKFTDRLDYNTSSYINQRIVNIMPILTNEQERMETNLVEINCPKILIFTNVDAKDIKMTVQDYMNKKLQELVKEDYKIIDFGKLDEEFNDDNTRIIYMYIKYTS